MTPEGGLWILQGRPSKSQTPQEANTNGDVRVNSAEIWSRQERS